MKRIIFLGGYARSGKSTAVTLLREMEIPCFSTSEFLYTVAARIWSIGGSYNTTLQQLKNTLPDAILWNTGGLTKRQFLIHVAENVIVPSYGRGEGIVKPVMNQALEELDISPIVAIETIGGFEYQQLLACVPDYATYIPVNIRRHTELAGADIRELLPDAVDIWNEGSINDLENQIKSIL